VTCCGQESRRIRVRIRAEISDLSLSKAFATLVGSASFLFRKYKRWVGVQDGQELKLTSQQIYETDKESDCSAKPTNCPSGKGNLQDR